MCDSLKLQFSRSSLFGTRHKGSSAHCAVGKWFQCQRYSSKFVTDALVWVAPRSLCTIANKRVTKRYMLCWFHHQFWFVSHQGMQNLIAMATEATQTTQTRLHMDWPTACWGFDLKNQRQLPLKTKEFIWSHLTPIHFWDLIFLQVGGSQCFLRVFVHLCFCSVSSSWKTCEVEKTVKPPEMCYVWAVLTNQKHVIRAGTDIASPRQRLTACNAHPTVPQVLTACQKGFTFLFDWFYCFWGWKPPLGADEKSMCHKTDTHCYQQACKRPFVPWIWFWRSQIATSHIFLLLPFFVQCLNVILEVNDTWNLLVM